MRGIFLIIAAFFTSLVNGEQNIQTEYVNDVDNNNVVRVEDISEEVKSESLVFEKYVGTISTSSGNWWSYPDDIKDVTRDGDDLLVLVNKEYQLPSTYAPTDLVKASLSGIRNGDSFYIRDIVIDDLTNLVSQAQGDGIDLSIVSGYRSYSTQVNTYSYWVRYNGGSVDAADRVSARAGHSQHQLGTAIDFSSDEIDDVLGSSFANTNASDWLRENAWRYGFVLSYPSGYENTTGYSYESWHYRYIGVSNAAEMHDMGVILEMYLRNKNGV